jgi:hypothetical protein
VSAPVENIRDGNDYIDGYRDEMMSEHEKKNVREDSSE